MWKNKQIKRRSRKSLRANYLTIVILCFVLTFFGILSGLGSQLTSMNSPALIIESAETESAINSVSAPYTPGLVTYLNDFFAGSETSRQTASSVLASFKNTGGILYNIMYRVDQFIFTHDTAAKAIVAIAIIAYLAYYFLLKNVLQVGFSRFLMETRVYKKTGASSLFILFTKGGAMHSAAIMLARTIFLAAIAIISMLPFVASAMIFLITEMLWPVAIGIILTIALAFIYILQQYSLFLVPYILAENPTVSRKAAFTLSRNMMKGSRLHAFRLEMSFLGWNLLSILTAGILSIFYVTPYRYMARTEMYMNLRQHAIDSDMQNSACFNDSYLTMPPAELLKAANIQPSQSVEIYPLAYPASVPHRNSRLIGYVQDLDPSRHYSIITLVLFFFIFSFIGWCWEVSIHLVKDAVFINRGTMFGPWLPIYGVGGVLIITLLKRFAKKPHILFASAIVLCCIIEYFSSLYLEKMFGLRYWDYSNYFLNLNGRICLEGALVFALGGLVFVYIAGPMLDNMLSGINATHRIAAAIILVLLFGADFTYSQFHPNQGKGITDYHYNSYELYGSNSIYKQPETAKHI